MVVDSNMTRGYVSRSVCCFRRLAQGVLEMLLERACEGVGLGLCICGQQGAAWGLEGLNVLSQVRLEL